MRCDFSRGLMLSLGCLLVLALPAGAHDWYSWRGPEHNGVSRAKDLPEVVGADPKEADSNLLWKAPYGCRSTPIVLGGRVYINNQVGEGLNEQERVMCLDANTGKVLWEKRFNVFHTDIVSVRLGWTNLAADPKTGNVYWHGTQGDLVCFDKDGKVLWQRQLTEQDGRISGYGGRLTSPVVDGDLVIVGMMNAGWGDQGGGGNRFLAVNKYDGKVVWWGDPGITPRNTYYSTPVPAVVNGQRLLVSGSYGAVVALNAHTGKAVWKFPYSKEAINASPVVDGNRVYAAHGNENLHSNEQGGIACLDMSEVKDGQPKVVWEVEGIKIQYTSPILHEGRLYFGDNIARLYCLDAATGNRLWRFTYGRNAKGSPVWADGKIYVADVNSKFHILQPGPKKCKELHDVFIPAPDGADTEINGSCAVANGRIYLGTRDELFCWGKKDHGAKAGPVPTAQAEPPVGEAAGVRLYPAEVTLRPGESAAFEVVALDKFGRAVAAKGDSTGEWLLPAPPKPAKAKGTPPALKGKVEGGKLTVDAKLPAQWGVVQYKGPLGTATARVRVIPVLPYRPDFDKLPDNAVPGGWVNASGKFAVAPSKDGGKVLRKNNTNPNSLFAQSSCYFGTPDLADYTIECDVLGGRKQRVADKGFDMPDVGVINSRYTLTLVGNLQRLRLLSWDAMPRVDQAVDFKFDANVWYRMKLTVEPRGDKVTVRGKVWPRAEKEPEAWAVEFVDPTPNREGAPGLYGFSTGIQEDEPGTEILYDNLVVTPNKQGAGSASR